MAGQSSEVPRLPVNPPAIETEIKQGDVLYIPRGWTHDASATSLLSLHVTLGVFLFTWADALLEYVSHRVLNDAAFRSALPLGFLGSENDNARLQNHFQTFLSELASDSDFQIARASFASQFADQMQPSTSNLLIQIELARHLNQETTVRLKNKPDCAIRDQASAFEMSVPGGTLIFERKFEEALIFCLARNVVQVKNLPGSLTPDEKLEMVRQLIRSQVVEIVSLRTRPGKYGDVSNFTKQQSR